MCQNLRCTLINVVGICMIDFTCVDSTCSECDELATFLYVCILLKDILPHSYAVCLLLHGHRDTAFSIHYHNISPEGYEAGKGLGSTDLERKK